MLAVIPTLSFSPIHDSNLVRKSIQGSARRGAFTTGVSERSQQQRQQQNR